MEVPKNALLKLDGVSHDLGMLHRVAGAAPVIELELSKLNAMSNLHPHLSPQHAVQLLPAGHALEGQKVVVYKQGEGFTVLLGFDQVRAALSTGRLKMPAKLVSTPALKKCRQSPEAPPPRAVWIPPAHLEEDRAPSRPAWRDKTEVNNRLPLGPGATKLAGLLKR